MKALIFVLIAAALVGGGFYAWQSGLLNFQMEEMKAQQVETETATQEQTQNETVPDVQETEQVSENQTAEEKIQEYKQKPTLCQSDSDCKIIPITCNKCDCGRAVNIYIEPYACTQADKANPCNFSCPASKAVCEDGVCKKVNA